MLGGRESVQHCGPHYQHLLHAIVAFPIGKSLLFFSGVQGCPVAVSSWADGKVKKVSFLLSANGEMTTDEIVGLKSSVLSLLQLLLE